MPKQVLANVEDPCHIYHVLSFLDKISIVLSGMLYFWMVQFVWNNGTSASTTYLSVYRNMFRKNNNWMDGHYVKSKVKNPSKCLLLVLHLPAAQLGTWWANVYKWSMQFNKTFTSGNRNLYWHSWFYQTLHIVTSRRKPLRTITYLQAGSEQW